MMLARKSPGAALDYQVDWTTWLKGDQLQSSSWSFSSSNVGLVIVSDTFDPHTTTVMLSGGVEGEDYVLTNQVATVGGRGDEQTLIVRCAKDSLTPGENSFGTAVELAIVTSDMPTVRVLPQVPRAMQDGALVQAWHNISRMPVEIYRGLTRREWSDPSVVSNRLPFSTLDVVRCTADLTTELMAELHPRVLLQLRRAQVIEADLLLGANPIEDRRRLGMISDSSGESTQFFRTRIPLELPIRKETANELTGLISYSFKTGRG